MISRTAITSLLERHVANLALLAVVLAPVTGIAADRHYERKAFALTDISGHLEEYLDHRDHNGKAVKFLRSQLNAEIGAYVYHPDVLNLQFGVGGTHSKSTVEGDSGGFESSDFSPDYRLRLNFVQASSYPVSFYFDQSNPLDLATNVAVSRKETLKGMEFHLKPPLIPLNNISSNISRRSTALKRGVSLSQQQTDRLEVDAYKTWNEWHKTNFSLSWQEYSELTMDRTNSLGRARLNSDHLFGDRNQVHVITDLSYIAHETSGTESSTMTATPSVDWDVTDRFNISFSTGFSREERTEYTTDSNSIRVGAAYRLSDSITVNGFAMAQNEDGDQLNHDYVDLEGRVRVNRKIAGGMLSASSSVSLSENDRWSSLGNLSVLDERLTLSGTESQALRYEDVVVSTIRVTDLAGSYEFREGIDYRLIDLGTTIEIERLASGNIEDGEEVSVTYDRRTPGSGEYSITSLQQSLSYQFFEKLIFQMNFHDRKVDTASDDINVRPERNIQLSLRSEFFKITDTIGIRGGIKGNQRTTESRAIDALNNLQAPNESPTELLEKELQNSSISADTEVFVDFPASRLSLSTRIGVTRNDFAEVNNFIMNTDEMFVALSVNYYPWARTRISGQYRFEDQDGGTNPIERTSAELGFDWSHGLLSIDTRYTYQEELYGSTEYKISSLICRLKRRF